ncbi:hypothetical protein [Melaminivora sp.]|uniref:hypothetical protein n=1 Tax=Melaminivora sp. TaxID=1933032 RepID=UPI0028A95943|nr:hypothetical protein [Melaminivora sp.]
MANGKLGAADCAAATHVTLYAVPAGTVATMNVNLCNRTAGAIKVSLSIGTAATPGNADYIEHEAEIQPHDVLERTGLVASAGERVIVHAAAAGISARVMGFEESV